MAICGEYIDGQIIVQLTGEFVDGQTIVQLSGDSSMDRQSFNALTKSSTARLISDGYVHTLCILTLFPPKQRVEFNVPTLFPPKQCLEFT